MPIATKSLKSLPCHCIAIIRGYLTGYKMFWTKQKRAGSSEMAMRDCRDFLKSHRAHSFKIGRANIKWAARRLCASTSGRRKKYCPSSVGMTGGGWNTFGWLLPSLLDRSLQFGNSLIRSAPQVRNSPRRIRNRTRVCVLKRCLQTGTAARSAHIRWVCKRECCDQCTYAKSWTRAEIDMIKNKAIRLWPNQKI